MSFDPTAFGTELAAIIRGHVERQIAPLAERIEELETRAGIVAPRGKKGKRRNARS